MSHGKKITYRKKLSKEDVEKQIIQTEKILQAEIISANPKTEEIIEENLVESVSNLTAPSPKRKGNLRRFFRRAKFQ